MAYVVSGPLVLLQAAALFFLFILAAYGAGARAVSGVWEGEGGPLIEAAAAVSIGLLFLALWIFTVGSLGWLNRDALAPFALAGFWGCARHKARLAAAFGDFRAVFFGGKLQTALSLAVLSLAALSFVASAAPLTGNDALTYHLYFPKTYIEAGKILFDPAHPRSLWPSFMGMLFTAGLLYQGTALATLFSWATAFLAVILVPAAAALHLKSRSSVLAATFFAGLVPAVWMQGMYPYTDNAMALYGFLAFLALLALRKNYAARPAFAAGLAFAALVSIKFYAFIPAAILGAVFVPGFVRDPAPVGAKSRAIAVLKVTVFAAAGFWYVRNWMHTGNPVYPFARGLFGGNGYPQGMVGAAHFSRNFFVTPASFSLIPDQYGSEPVGMLFLAGLPLLLCIPTAAAAAVLALAVTGLYYVQWYFTMQQARFFLPVVPFVAFAWAALAAKWWEGGTALKKLALGAFAVLGLLQAALCVYYPARHIPAALGLEPPARFLAREERSYAFMKEIQPLLTPHDRVLVVLEPRIFYVPARVVYFSPHIARLYGRDFDGWLRKEGITHVLTMRREDLAPVPPGYFRDDQVIQGGAQNIASLHTRVDDDVFHYALWRIGGGQPRLVKDLVYAS